MTTASSDASTTRPPDRPSSAPSSSAPSSSAASASASAAALFTAAVALVDELVRELRDPSWSRPTPCADWNVSGLVNHLTVEDLWAVELFAGAAVEDVGHRFDGNRLGAVPLDSWTSASRAAVVSAASPGAPGGVVHLSFGDVPDHEYAMQLFADHLVHAWDLSRALDRPAELPDDLVEACLAWFAPHEDNYREAGLIGPRPPLPPGAIPADRLLAAFGRTP
jgi:uncharacterized protein (TIGR03086 family)